MPVGYSGHEVGLAPTLAAVALGACLIERHITLDRAMWGSDQAASVEPQGFARLVKDIRAIEPGPGRRPETRSGVGRSPSCRSCAEFTENGLRNRCTHPGQGPAVALR